MSRSTVARELRLPLFVPVRTDPLLPGCFSSNVSSTGIGLVCNASAERLLQRGAQLSLAFPLPGSSAEVRARGEIMWVFGRPSRSGGGVETAVGVRFVDVAAQDRAAFSRYLSDNRYHVAIAFADRGETEAMREVAGATHHLHFAANEAELEETLLGGDISALCVFGREGQAAAANAARVLTRLIEGTTGTLLPGDLLPAVIYCGQSSPDELLSLINAGFVYRVLPPPLDLHALAMALQKACAGRGERSEQARLAERALSQKREPEKDAITVETGVIGANGGLAGTLQRLRRAAPHKISVLLVGETGAGKEVLASLTHELSPRAQQPFVVQDCGALPVTLLDSALFGHTKGAFTGAHGDAPGLFVLAHGGTVFLDEVENTTPDLQAKLLRVIETGEVRPVGGAKVRHVDVRIVAATNRDLAAEVKAGRFREDLYYRLNIFPIRVPPLRERKSDILPLAQHFLALGARRFDRSAKGFTAQAIAALTAHAWPGNVRELLNAIEVALIMCDPGEERIALHHLPDTLHGASGDDDDGAESLDESVRAFERERIRAALASSGGVIRRAAAMLRTHPVTLRRKAIQHGLHMSD